MRIVPTLLVLLALSGAARAEGAIATAGKVAAPPQVGEGADALAPTTGRQVEAFLGTGELPPEARRIHGEVGVAVGSGGYRSAYGVAVIPVGQTGTVAVAVSEGRGGRGRFLAPCRALPATPVVSPAAPGCALSPNASRLTDVAN